jgi:hypothetical protein
VDAATAAPIMNQAISAMTEWITSYANQIEGAEIR